MHITDMGLTRIMNAQNYLSLLGFSLGNLLEVGACFGFFVILHVVTDML
jgi:hypothetical protein